MHSIPAHLLASTRPIIETTLGGLLVAACVVIDTGCTSSCVLPAHVQASLVRNTHRDPDGMWVVDGDVPISSEEDLNAFYAAWACQEPSDEDSASEQASELAIQQHFGQDSRWSDAEKRSISYCVSTAFNGNHATVVAAMQQAAADWSAEADVRLVYDSAQDANCVANANVVFRVQPTTGANYLARAFFPDDGRDQRNLLIDATGLTPTAPLTLAGVLRHEIGHVLGFRHEHIRQSNPGTCAEDSGWRGLTPYDPNSVMHYPQCPGSTNKGDLLLTAWDGKGAAAVYGTSGQRPQPEVCNNAIDDDLNGTIDDGCPVEVCGNGLDDDGDGGVDENCPVVLTPEVCANGIDDNGNGTIDEGCPQPESCNGRDDDLNGLVDDSQSCHDVVIRMTGIDDDAFIWIQQPGSTNDAICSVRFHSGHPGFGECSLSAIMRSRGNPETTHFALKIGNGGGFASAGLVEAVIDGGLEWRHEEANRVRHTGWIYEVEFDVNFRTGTFAVTAEKPCVNHLDCHH